MSLKTATPGKARKVLTIDIQTGQVLKEFDSVSAAAKEYKLTQPVLWHWLSGKTRQPCDREGSRQHKSTAWLSGIRFTYSPPANEERPEAKERPREDCLENLWREAGLTADQARALLSLYLMDSQIRKHVEMISSIMVRGDK